MSEIFKRNALSFSSSVSEADRILSMRERSSWNSLKTAKYAAFVAANPEPPKESNASRCLAGALKRICSLCPWIVTSSLVISSSTETGTAAPPITALDLPSLDTVRLIRISFSAVSQPSSWSLVSSSGFEEKILPSTKSCWLPLRTVEESALVPNSKPKAVSTIVLPAPVSPVRAVNPGPNSRFAELMTPMFRMPRLAITQLPPDLATRLPGAQIF